MASETIMGHRPHHSAGNPVAAPSHLRCLPVVVSLAPLVSAVEAVDDVASGIPDIFTYEAMVSPTNQLWQLPTVRK